MTATEIMTQQRASRRRRFVIYRGGTTPQHQVMASHRDMKISMLLLNAQTYRSAVSDENRYYVKLPSQQVLAQGTTEYDAWIEPYIPF